MELNCLKCDKKDENVRGYKDIGSLCETHFNELDALIKQFFLVQLERIKREGVIGNYACGDCGACRWYPCVNNDAVL